MSFRPRALLGALLGMTLAGLAGPAAALGHSATPTNPGVPATLQATGHRQKRKKSVNRRQHWKSGGKFLPHQGRRECARRRGDWATVSMIDANKRFPYGFNFRVIGQVFQGDAYKVALQYGRVFTRKQLDRIHQFAQQD